MAIYKGNTIIAGGATRTWVGTKAAYDKAEAEKKIPDNTVIMITDKESEFTADLPIGSIVRYKGDTAPDGWLFCDGSTFDEAAYPKLYQTLGSNTLPEKYATLSSWTSATVTDVPANTTGKTITITAEHDGELQAYINATTSGSNYMGLYFTENGKRLDGIAVGGSSAYQYFQNTIKIHKGSVYGINYRNDGGKAYSAGYSTRYYNKDPYIIRALDASALTEYDTEQTKAIIDTATDIVSAKATDCDITFTRVSGTYNGVSSFFKRTNGSMVERWITLDYTGPNCAAQVYTTLLTMTFPGTVVFKTVEYTNAAKHPIGITTGGEIRLYNTNESQTFQPNTLMIYLVTKE